MKYINFNNFYLYMHKLIPIRHIHESLLNIDGNIFNEKNFIFKLSDCYRGTL